MSSPLQRFVDAQDAGGSFEAALAELRAGRKRTCWIHHVLPQRRGLSTSSRGIYYGIDGHAEAQAYLKDPILRDRLCLVIEAIHLHVENGVALAEIMGSDLNAMKVRSCCQLFGLHAALDGHPVCDALARKMHRVLALTRTCCPA